MAEPSAFALSNAIPRAKVPRMIADKIPDLKTLSVEEKLTLVGELGGELADNPAALPVREGHVQILRERMEQHRQQPADTISWEEVKSRILGAR